jgi:hypothetical protein
LAVQGTISSPADARHGRALGLFIEDGSKLVGGGEAGSGDFGYSVALSADGSTALVGGPHDGPPGHRGDGAAWVFTRSGQSWKPQGPKLAGRGEIGAGEFGWSVALSADGDTALVGGIADDGYVGAAWVFRRSGSTWVQQGPKLTGSAETGRAAFGWSVALSADGRTAVVGGPDDDRETGALWVLRRSGGDWVEQAGKLAGASFGDQFGSGVAISGNARTMLVGSDGTNGSLGAAWVLTRSGAGWAQRREQLVGRGESAGYGRFGWSVALSGDGNRAMIGSYAPLEGAWWFTRSGGAWSGGEKLSGSGETGYGGFGAAVALSGDGGTALVGGSDASWVYAWSGTTWSPRRTKLTGRGASPGGTFAGGRFGYSVALSGNGTTAVVGAPGDSNSHGAAWLFGR